MSLEETGLPVTYFFLSTEEDATIAHYTWVVIAASCVGAIMLLGAVTATVYCGRRKRGYYQPQWDNTAHVKETENSQKFDNPVYDNAE